MKIAKRLNWALAVLGASCVSFAAVGAASAQVNVAIVPVGNPGNMADPATGFGSVAYSYSIGKLDVTAGQYTAFLNAVAASDPYGLYNTKMSNLLNTNDGYNGNTECGISQSGSAGSYTYSTTRNPNYPVNDISWGDAARFCNWLTNNQPSGPEGNGTTETGSYTLNGATTDAALNAVTRNANAVYVIPTLNEWYKAAYYNPTSSGYYLYPTRSNNTPSNTLSATGTNNANYYASGFTDPTNVLTVVGAFADSPSPYGTFDQGGDVNQWLESVDGSDRDVRGGWFDYPNYGLQSTEFALPTSPSAQYAVVGFRVAELASPVPEPTTYALMGLGAVAMLARRRGVHFSKATKPACSK